MAPDNNQDGAPDGEAPADDPNAAAPDAATGADASASASDGLLSMFQESKLEVEDLSLIVKMAGEVEMADLLEDLQTIAIALGIQRDAPQELALAA